MSRTSVRVRLNQPARLKPPELVGLPSPVVEDVRVDDKPQAETVLVLGRDRVVVHVAPVSSPVATTVGDMTDKS